jgi:aromatic-amino-acid transaminase
MFSALPAPKPDAILQISQLYRADTRDTKVDLGVGVYKDDTGNTPVMRAVKAAEQRLVDTQTTKTYTALAGDPAFHTAMADLLLAGTVAPAHMAAAAATGGTGAVRLAMELVKRANPGATVWISAPTWPNHNAIAKEVGLAWKPYRYYDADSGGLDRAGMWADLDDANERAEQLMHMIRLDKKRDVLAMKERELADYRGKVASMIFQEPLLALDPRPPSAVEMVAVALGTL